jgi:hypothetical protein
MDCTEFIEVYIWYACFTVNITVTFPEKMFFKLTPRSKVLLDKLIVAQLVNKLPVFIRSLPCSQQSSNSICPESYEFTQ